MTANKIIPRSPPYEKFKWDKKILKACGIQPEKWRLTNE